MTEPIRREIRVRCSVEHAFAVFTDRLDMWWPAGHRRFPRSRLRLEGREGGRFFERSETGEEAQLGEVVRWEPPHRLAYTWHPGSDVGPTLVEIEFSPEGDGTLVEVIHSEGDSGLGTRWRERAQRFERAWSTVLPAFGRCADESNGATQ
jgi:uncharacterized protein YndB with AHSA1/START domain